MKKILIIAVTLFAMLLSAGCSSVSTDSDEAAVVYNGGMWTSSTFDNCVGNSTREWNGPGDNDYRYPAGQRTFSFTGAEGSERGPMEVTTGSQEVFVPGFITLSLKTDCESLRKFHETIGKKYGAYIGGGGWNDFLSDYIAVPLSATLNKAAGAIETPEGDSKDQNWYLLYTDSNTQNAFEDYVKENLPGEIKKTLGADFVTINEVSIAKPTVSAELKGGLAAKEEARLQNEAQKERNTIAATKYDSLAACRESGLSESACITIFLAENGDIPFYPLPQGGNLNVSPSTK